MTDSMNSATCAFRQPSDAECVTSIEYDSKSWQDQNIPTKINPILFFFFHLTYNRSCFDLLGLPNFLPRY